MKLTILLVAFNLVTYMLLGQVGETLKSANAAESSATIRLKQHAQSGDCDVTIPDNPDWDISFKRENLKGDLVPNVKYIRRDPSSVIKVNGKYYVWYSYSLTSAPNKVAPWDLNDIYYASSTDGYVWEEHGPAVERGKAGSFDYRSVFTTEVFYHEGIFYLVYQTAANEMETMVGTTVSMAYASSPHGPWTKLKEPVLNPSTGSDFDNGSVHDPCLIYFKNKFYLYYKGEGGSSGPVCGLGVWGDSKQVKWGVAISDNPTGPFVRSEYNPITNTGHEVCVWNSGDGIGIMLHQDGPEYGTTQYASDGVNFEIKGKIDFVLKDYSTDFPEAAGVYRPIGEETSPVSGVSWGICHVLTDEFNSNWMYLKRFENKDKSAVILDTDNDGIVVSAKDITGTIVKNDISIYPNPVNDILKIKSLNQGVYSFEITSTVGQTIVRGIYDTKSGSINVSDLTEGIYILNLYNIDNSECYKVSFIKGSN